MSGSFEHKMSPTGPKIEPKSDADIRSAAEVLPEKIEALEKRAKLIREKTDMGMKASQSSRDGDTPEKDRQRRAVWAVASTDHFSLVGLQGEVNKNGFTAMDDHITLLEKKYSDSAEGKALLDASIKAMVTELEISDEAKAAKGYQKPSDWDEVRYGNTGMT